MKSSKSTKIQSQPASSQNLRGREAPPTYDIESVDLDVQRTLKFLLTRELSHVKSSDHDAIVADLTVAT